MLTSFSTDPGATRPTWQGSISTARPRGLIDCRKDPGRRLDIKFLEFKAAGTGHHRDECDKVKNQMFFLFIFHHSARPQSSALILRG
jgi:hypothetical protein